MHLWRRPVVAANRTGAALTMAESSGVDIAGVHRVVHDAHRDTHSEKLSCRGAKVGTKFLEKEDVRRPICRKE